MNWRGPWLRKRIQLSGFAIKDVLALWVSYTLLLGALTGKWEYNTNGFAVIAIIWIASSYLSGRYEQESDKGNHRLIERVVKALIPAAAVLAVFVGHSWLFGIVDATTRVSYFLIPFLGVSICLSVAGDSWLSSSSPGKRKWLVMCTDAEKSVIASELRLDEYSCSRDVEFINSEHLERYFASAHKGSKNIGVAFGRIRNRHAGEIEKVLRMRKDGITVLPLVNWCEQELQRIPTELVSADWLLEAEGFSLRQHGVGWRLKRLGDIAGAAVLILLLFPLMILAGACVWAEDRGPIFYRQRRTGINGEEFFLTKFRSMKTDAEAEGAQWATKDDSRVTRVGRIIRATRIDELPQLGSVLSGELSLIGPRPERPEFENTLRREIENYNVRQWVRPGLSGWAQVCFPYGASVTDARIKLGYDIYYIRNWSIFLDILIVVKTIKLVLLARGSTPKGTGRP